MKFNFTVRGLLVATTLLSAALALAIWVIESQSILAYLGVYVLGYTVPVVGAILYWRRKRVQQEQLRLASREIANLVVVHGDRLQG